MTRILPSCSSKEKEENRLKKKMDNRVVKFHKNPYKYLLYMSLKSIFYCLSLIALLSFPLQGENSPDTSIMDAVAEGNADKVQRLITEGRDINAANSRGNTALMVAAQRDNAELVELLLKNRANPDAKDKYGWTALIAAARAGRTEVARVLLQNGADHSITDKDGKTALLHAIDMARTEMVTMLQEFGANPRKQGTKEVSATETAIRQGRTEALEPLLAKGGINQKNAAGMTPLMIAVRADRKDMVRLLLEKGADINVKDYAGKTAFFYSIHKKVRTPIFDMLLEKGAEYDITDNSGMTSLMQAVQSGNVEIAGLMIEKGVDINARKKDELTAIHIAASQGNKEMMNFLISKGASLTVRDKDSNLPLMISLMRNHVDSARLLYEAKPDVVPELIYHTGMNDLDKVKELLGSGNVDVNKRASGGQSALFLAALKKNEKMVRLLLQHKADPNLKDKKGDTPLMAAKGNTPTMIALLEYGATVQLKGKFVIVGSPENNLLVETAGKGDTALVEALIKYHNADVNAVNFKGTTPIMAAAKSGHLKTVAYLLKSGAKVALTDNENKTVFEHAEGNPEVYALLKKTIME